MARVPYMVADGNHERDWPHSGDRFPDQRDSGGECGVPHERRFLMPSEAQDEPWCAPWQFKKTSQYCPLVCLLAAEKASES